VAIERPTISVEVFSNSCRYLGQVVQRGIRLVDLLSDPTSDLLELHDVVVHPHGYPSAGVRCPEVLIKKSEVLIVVPQGNVSPSERRPDGCGAKNQRGTLLVLPGYLLMGVVQLPERSGRLTLLSPQSTLPSFVGVGSVILHTAVPGCEPQNYDWAIVHRDSIEAIHLSAELTENDLNPNRDGAWPAA
jgi:hypothetical protein